MLKLQNVRRAALRRVHVWPGGAVVSTVAFQAANTGSTPVRATKSPLEAMKLAPTIVLLVLLSGCQSPPPRVTDTIREAEAARAAQDAIEAARQEAYSRYLECGVRAEARLNEGLKVEGTPVP